MCEFHNIESETVAKNPIANEYLFLISALDPWYGDIIIYLQTKTFHLELS